QVWAAELPAVTTRLRSVLLDQPSFGGSLGLSCPHASSSPAPSQATTHIAITLRGRHDIACLPSRSRPRAVGRRPDPQGNAGDSSAQPATARSSPSGPARLLPPSLSGFLPAHRSGLEDLAEVGPHQFADSLQHSTPFPRGRFELVRQREVGLEVAAQAGREAGV